jgi:type IV pilus assembly protein PilM
MEFLPTTLGTRPRLAVELRREGIVAARAENAAAVLTAVSRADLPEGALVAGLKAGNIVDRATVVAAFRQVLEAVADKGNGRGRELTLIVPDAAVRVLLLDFDSLPGKLAEALPVVRFRLKKMLPFEAEDAAVSYQVMSSGKTGVRVLAVAMPREVLAEYESVVREAGFEPGAVLPSTLAALAGLEVEEDAATLVVNAGPQGVTTAIVLRGVVLLHRSVDMTTEEPQVEPVVSVSLVDREDSMEEWALQQPTGIGGTAEAARRAAIAEPNAVLDDVREELRELAETSGSREVGQAVSVAAAYFEDTLGLSPGVILAAGTTGATRLGQILRDADIAAATVQVREIVEPQMIAEISANVPRGWLAGVRGALKN